MPTPAHGADPAPRTLVCVPLTPLDAADDNRTIEEMQQAKSGGADIIELRIDSIFDGSTGSDTEDGALIKRIRSLIDACPLPLILTCRIASEGGDYDGDESDRISLFEKLTAASKSPPAYLDVEWASFSRSANIAQKVRLCVRHPGQLRDVASGLILSTHDFTGRPQDLMRRVLAMSEQASASVVKVAFRARSLRDALEALDLPAQTTRPTIALAMGEFGLASRILAGKFGAFLTFAALRSERATAPGQPTLSELIDLYRFRAIGPSTSVYGVVGWPVGHSLSPLVHNAGFDAIKHDGVYLPLPIGVDESDPEASYLSFKATMLELIEYPRLSLRGVSVTMPHKEHLFRLARECAWSIDTVASAIGSANTLAIESSGPVANIAIMNTDAPAISLWLAQGLGTSLSGKRIGILGAGGVARAAAYAAARSGATVVVYARDGAKAQKLCDDISAGLTREGKSAKLVAAAWDLIPKSCCDAIINGTPLGMSGGTGADQSPMDRAAIEGCGRDTVYFDTVYSPVETPLLALARGAGRRTIDGVGMFVEQAALQFETWTDTGAPRGLFDRIVREKLAEHESARRNAS